MNRNATRIATILCCPLLATAGSQFATQSAAQAATQVAAQATFRDTPPLDDACWQETFVDDFDELDLRDESAGAVDDDGRWRTRYIWGRDTIINHELQYYIDPVEHGLSPFAVDEGTLSIIARRTPAELADAVGRQGYVSGVLTTEKSFSQKYGRFEAHARIPSGRGLWSALWLLPSFDSWPEGVAVLPEIDIMESLGHTPDVLHTTLHTNQTGELTSHGYETRANDLSLDFHLYSVVWTPESVTWFLDRKPVARHPTPADFTRPVHFLLNLAVGGGWPGAPDADTVFPAKYQIDYVRAWKDSGTC